MKELRAYQLNIVNKVVASKKDILICLPTGAGKTVIAGNIIAQLKETVVFIVPRLELIEQAKSEFSEILGDVDILWSDKTSITGKHCIIASKESIPTQKENIPKGATLIFDEVHVGLEETHKIIKDAKPKRVLGLTATPERMDGLALLKGTDALHKYGCFDELLQEESVASLIDKGYLAPIHYYSKPIEGITEEKSRTANGEELADEQITEIFDKNNIWGDLVESYRRYGKLPDGSYRKAIGFCNTIKMAEKVTQIFNDAGYSFKLISGEMNVAKRKELIDELVSGKINGLVNAALLTYGFDCPPVSYAFSCRHIKSRPLWFQIVGRILRLSEGKDRALFVDHGDSASEFIEADGTLPITNPYIEWRANGEDERAKKTRRRRQKEARKKLEEVAELDPLPCEMIRLDGGSTVDRLVRTIKKIQEQDATTIEGLQEQIAQAQQESANKSRTIKDIHDKWERMQRDDSHTIMRLREVLHDKNDIIVDKNNTIENLTAQLADAQDAPSTKEQKQFTFNFVKDNYSRTKWKFLEKEKITDKRTLREKTDAQLREYAKAWGVYVDENTWQEGVSYWVKKLGLKD